MSYSKANHGGSGKSEDRVQIPRAVRHEVLRKGRRRCCMCFGLKGDLGVKQGQIAHLDRNRTNPSPKNLAFLCQECHTVYDTKSNRVLAFTPDEVKFYRDHLYQKLGHNMIEWHLTIRAAWEDYDAAKFAVDKARTILREYTNDVTLKEAPVDQS